MSIYNHSKKYLAGRIEHVSVDSALLKNNPLGDPHQRIVPVYVPADYTQSEQDYPVLYYLAAYTNSGLNMPSWRNFGENICERLDRLIAEQQMGPVIVVFPDAFTRLGGNQYLDSAGIGAYASHIHEEIIPLMESTFRIKQGAQHRAVLGKSSGGFAAIRFAMDFPGFWGAIANHSGDAGFDILYQRDFPAVADTLAEFNYDSEKFIKRFWRAKKIMGSHILTMMHLCMAASYDPGEDGQIQLPFDLKSCVIDTERWSYWQAHDPVNRVADHEQALQQLNGLFMDCGFRDQYFIHYGMRQLSDQLEKHKIDHIYQEFNGSHSGIDYRLDESLPFLYEKIQ